MHRLPAITLDIRLRHDAFGHRLHRLIVRAKAEFPSNKPLLSACMHAAARHFSLSLTASIGHNMSSFESADAILETRARAVHDCRVHR